MSSWERALKKGVDSCINFSLYVSVGMLFVLMLLGAVDVIGRYFLNRPLPGTIEISQILLAATVFFAWPHTQAMRAHVRSEFIVTRFSYQKQLVLDLVTSVLTLALFSTIVWRGTVTAMMSKQQGRVIDIINIPLFPFQLFVTFGGLLVCFVVILQIIEDIRQFKK